MAPSPRPLRSRARVPEAAGGRGEDQVAALGGREGAPRGGSGDPVPRPSVGLSGCRRVLGALKAVGDPAL